MPQVIPWHIKSATNAIEAKKIYHKNNLKYATQLMNELKMCHKIMLYHNKYNNCHKLFPDT